MKKLFIYYSFTGNGDIIAKTLEEKGYEIRKVVPKTPLPSNFFLSMMTGGFKALINKKDKLINFNSNINDYSKIIIGTPIWNDRICSPINAALDLLNLKDKEISFILYSGSGKANNASKKIKSIYGVEPIILKQPKDNKEELKKLKEVK